MYTAINWALDLGLYAAVCAITCALWWLLGRRGETSATAGRAEASTDSAQSAGRVSRARLTVAQALPLIYRRSKQTGALLPREENPDTPTTAEIPTVAAPASSMWRFPRALPLAWILYAAGLLIFTLLPLPSDPVAACAARMLRPPPQPLVLLPPRLLRLLLPPQRSKLSASPRRCVARPRRCRVCVRRSPAAWWSRCRPPPS